MRNINSVVLVGRLVRDAEMKYTNSGVPVSNFSIAVNTSKKVGDNWEDVGNFFDASLMGKMAESINKYMTKGSKIGLYGSLVQDRWEKDGQKHSRVKIRADFVELLDSKGSGGSQGQSQRGEESQGDFFEDDVPF